MMGEAGGVFKDGTRVKVVVNVDFDEPPSGELNGDVMTVFCGDGGADAISN